MPNEIINKPNDPVKIIGEWHGEVHEGKVFTLTFSKDAIADNGELLIRLKINSNYLHFTSYIETVGKWKFESLLDSTYTSDGTLLTTIPRRSDTSKTFETLIYEAPTIDVEGLERFNYFFGYGENPAKTASSQNSDDMESLFEPNKDLLLRFTNLSGSSQYLTLILNMYETSEII